MNKPTIELTEEGYWLASERYAGRLMLAEGETEREAEYSWIDLWYRRQSFVQLSLYPGDSSL